MRDRKIVFVVVGLIAGVIAVWLYQRSKQSETPATSSVTQPRTGSSEPIVVAPKSPRSSLAVTVSNAKGPLANAAVRIAPENGEVIVIKTDAKGVATATQLSAGEYEISASAPDHEPAAASRTLKDGEAGSLAIT